MKSDDFLNTEFLSLWVEKTSHHPASAFPVAESVGSCCCSGTKPKVINSK